MTTLTAANPAMVSMGPPLPPRSAPAPQAGLSGADVIRIIRARLLMIILLWLLFFAIGTAITLIFYFWYPSYTATSYIRVQSTSPVNVMSPLERQRVEAEEVQRLLQDQALLVKSPQVIGAALEDNDLRVTEWYKEAEKKQKEKGEDISDLLLDILQAAPVRDSNYVGVTATWRLSKEVPTLVNTVVRKYVEKINELQKDNMRSTEQGMNKELSAAKNQYETMQRTIEEFRTAEQLLSKPGDEEQSSVATYTSLVTELTIDLEGKKSIYESLKDVKASDLPITPDLQNLLLTDPKINQYDQELQQEEQTLTNLQARFGPGHRLVKEAINRRDLAAKRAEEERATKIVKYQNDQIEQARRSYLEGLDQLTKLKEKLLQAQLEHSDRDMKYWRLNKMIEESEQLKTQYERLLEQHNQVTMVLRMEKSVQIDVRSSAVQPRRRSQPKLEIWLPAAGVLGMALALGVAMLLELSDTSVRTPRDIIRQSMPVLGTIPVTDDDEIEIERVETASLDAPHSIVAEAFRNLRTNLFFCAPAEQQTSLLVTSPSGGNGKTTVATNLAIAIALSGRRVLLVDANFRRVGLPRIFPGIPAEGLSNLLIGSGRLENFVTSTSVPGLDVLGAGPIPPNPAELLGSSYLRDVIADARARYDQIIFDGPPLLLVSDAMMLAASVDGVIMVCQYRVTSRGALQRCHSQLSSMGARIFGAVLDFVETRAGGYFRKSYREFYEYHEEDEADEGGKRPRLDSAMPADEAGAATADAVGHTDFESPSLLGDDSLAGLGTSDSTSDTASTHTDSVGGEAWGGADIDQEINKINGDHALGDPDDFKISDDLDLDDDSGKPSNR